MRLHFRFTRNLQKVPFNYQDNLISCFHKWMGWNQIHDEISLYSLSWLQGGVRIGNGLNFSNGANWFISFWDENIGKSLIKNAVSNPEFIYGMKLLEINIQETPEFGSRERFVAASPILIRKYDDKHRAIHLTVNDEDSDSLMTRTLKNKIKVAGLDFDILVKFDRTFHNPKTKLVIINGIANKANFCPVILEGEPQAIKFAWNVGIGHLTGCGFGSLL